MTQREILKKGAHAAERAWWEAIVMAGKAVKAGKAARKERDKAWALVKDAADAQDAVKAAKEVLR